MIGQTLACPFCQGPFVIPYFTPPVSPPSPNGQQSQKDWSPSASPKEEIVSRDAITIGELLTFLRGLPDRPMTRRFPDGNHDQLPLGKFLIEHSGVAPESFVFASDKHFILKEARKQSGWVCLVFGCAFDHLQSLLLASERSVIAENDAHQVVDLLREIESHVEIGITRDEYAKLLSIRWLRIKDFAEKHRDAYPIFTSVIEGAFQNYRTALDIWIRGASTLPFQFTGGGFGLAAAAQGMALSMGLNSLVDAFNQSKQLSLEQRRAAEWAVGSKKIRIARCVLQPL